MTIDASQPSTLYASVPVAPDMFVVKLDPAGSVVFSTYLGGSGSEAGVAIAADAAGNAYVIGWTNSRNFPFTNALNDFVGTREAFVVKISTWQPPE